MNVLVTGGAGYIGSHAALRLMADGHVVTILDDFSRGRRGAVEALRRLGEVEVVEADCCDQRAVARVLGDSGIELVMHFAALAYVDESVREPLGYWRTNVAGTMALLEAMRECGTRRLVFSSTCSTYGEPAPDDIPIGESCPQRPASPYGRSKLAAEHLIADHHAAETEADRGFAFATLRYFNVAGCDAAGRLGEDHDPETHLIPVCLDAALGRLESVTVHGTDYDTPDGTCIRDYVCVDDVVDAHLVAMGALGPGAALTYNVGIGTGHSVRQVIDACQRVSGVEFEVVEGPRRPGDAPILSADPSRIRDDLGWTARLTDLEEMIATAWRWRKDHPGGYGDGKQKRKRTKKKRRDKGTKGRRD